MNTTAQLLIVEAPLARDPDQDIGRIEEEVPVDTSTAGPTTLHVHQRELAKDPTRPVLSAAPESKPEEEHQDKQILTDSPLEVNENGKASSSSCSSPMTGIALKSSKAITERANGEGSKSHNQASERFKLPIRTEIGSGAAKELRQIESKKSDAEESKAVVSSEIEIDERKEKKSKTDKKIAKTKAKKSNLRKGKWTGEEEQYTMRIIQHFRTGLLSLPDGHTLRSYLADKLTCDPMRITKKFSGASCLGKRVYNLCDRSQVSSHDLAMAKAELEALEKRFKLRIEHGTSLPMPSQITDTFRNSRSEIDHANFMRASYLFVNHPSQSQNAVFPRGDVSSVQGVNCSTSDMYGNTNSNTNLQMAFLQNLAAGQQQQNQSVQSQANYQQKSSLQNQNFQMPQQNSQPLSRNAGSPFFNAQQRPGISQDILSALLKAQSNGSAQNVQSQLQSQAINSFSLNQSQSGPSSSSQGYSEPSCISAAGLSLFSGKTAMEALAARYNSAALQHQHLQRMQEVKVNQSTHRMEDRGGGENYSQVNSRRKHLSSASQQPMESVKKVHTKEEEAEGRMLLGFLQELQTNHQKASTPSANNSFCDAAHILSTNASSDGTATTRESSIGMRKDNILKRGFDITVKKDSDMDTASSVSGFNGSVPKNEGLSCSGDSSDDNKEGSSGDDAEKDVSAGPLRKRFRRGLGQGTIIGQDEIDSRHG